MHNEKLEVYKAKLEARLSKINREDFSINDLQFTDLEDVWTKMNIHSQYLKEENSKKKSNDFRNLVGKRLLESDLNSLSNPNSIVSYNHVIFHHLQEGFSPNNKIGVNKTPMIFLINNSNDKTNFLETLIKYGVDVNMLNENKKTVLDTIIEERYANPIDRKTFNDISLLLNAGAKINYEQAQMLLTPTLDNDFKNNAFNVLIAKSIAHNYPDFVTRFEMDNNKNNISKTINNIVYEKSINEEIVNNIDFVKKEFSNEANSFFNSMETKNGNEILTKANEFKNYIENNINQKIENIKNSEIFNVATESTKSKLSIFVSKVISFTEEVKDVIKELSNNKKEKEISTQEERTLN